jgi:hypothetical protein
MARLMLRTLFGAHPACFFTYNQKRVRKFRITKKQMNTLHTQLGAIAIKLDASGHHRYIFFVKASCCACLACNGAFH